MIESQNSIITKLQIKIESNKTQLCDLKDEMSINQKSIAETNSYCRNDEMEFMDYDIRKRKSVQEVYLVEDQVEAAKKNVIQICKAIDLAETERIELQEKRTALEVEANRLSELTEMVG